LWGLLIIILTSIPGTALPRIPKFADLLHPDKLVHVFMFGVFVFLLLRGFQKPGTPFWISRRIAITAILIGIILAGITELYQNLSFINRSASPWDFVANTIGCLAGWGTWRGSREVGR